MFPKLTNNQIEQIAHILGHTDSGFTGSEIGNILTQCNLDDPGPGQTKWIRLYNAFAKTVNESGSTNIVFRCIQCCMEPVQGIKNQKRYEWMLLELNKVLMLVGVEIKDNGQFYQVSKAQTFSEVQTRMNALRAKLINYNAHPEVLKCCNKELLAKDYFHAVQEAAKSLCDRVRSMSGLKEDGSELFNAAFGLRNPYVAYNSLRTCTERNEQNGLKEMLCGVMHMVRNVTAHELRIHWDVNEEDAVDILTQISYLHKLLDMCTILRKDNTK